MAKQRKIDTSKLGTKREIDKRLIRATAREMRELEKQRKSNSGPGRR